MAHSQEMIDKMIDRVIDNEGGYVNHPDDKGKETKYGITEAVARANGYKGSMKNLPKSKAFDIYKTRYWTNACQSINSQAASFLMLDMNANHGTKNASKILQRALNTLCSGLVVDGIAGAKTINAANNADEHSLILALTAERLRFFANIAKFTTFGKGWVRRVANNISFIDALGQNSIR